MFRQSIKDFLSINIVPLPVKLVNPSLNLYSFFKFDCKSPKF